MLSAMLSMSFAGNVKPHLLLPVFAQSEYMDARGASWYITYEHKENISQCYKKHVMRQEVLVECSYYGWKVCLTIQLNAVITKTRSI